MTATTVPTKRRARRLAVVFVLLGLAIKALAMPVAPVHWDTNYYLNIASNFIERGELTPYMWRLGPDTNIIAGSGTGYGILMLNEWFRLVGLSLASGYVFMYAVGVLTLAAVYRLAAAWWRDSAAGLGAAAFVALSGFFVEQFYIRMDAPAVLTYTLVLGLHLHAVRRRRGWLHFAVGAALVLAAEVHILALLYIGAISFYYAVEHLRALRQGGKLWQITPAVPYFAGLGLAGLVYGLVHIAPNPDAYFIIARDCPHCAPAGPAKELERYGLFLQHRAPELIVLALALLAALVRGRRSDQHYLTLVIGYLLAMAVVSPPAQVQYLGHLLPLMALGAGGLLARGFQRHGVLTRQRLRLGALAAGAMLLVQIGVWYRDFVTERESLPPGVEYVRAYVPTDTVVMGEPSLFHYLLRYDRFLSYKSGERYGIALRGEDYPTFWAREQPQVFVGQPDADDLAWWDYMRVHDFRQVEPDLWVAEDLVEALAAAHPGEEVAVRGGGASAEESAGEPF